MRLRQGDRSCLTCLSAIPYLLNETSRYFRVFVGPVNFFEPGGGGLQPRGTATEISTGTWEDRAQFASDNKGQQGLWTPVVKLQI
jgi:hypothetical protein